jgi:hypothetical protein
MVATAVFALLAGLHQEANLQFALHALLVHTASSTIALALPFASLANSPVQHAVQGPPGATVRHAPCTALAFAVDCHKTFLSTPAMTRTACMPGFGTTSCTGCTNGTYSVGGSMDSCVACPTGSTTTTFFWSTSAAACSGERRLLMGAMSWTLLSV